METGLHKRQIVAELTKSPHGDLAKYAPIGVQAAKDDSDFFAHLVAWNALKGEIRDAKQALPVLALAGTPGEDDVYTENALAHLATLAPTYLVKALTFLPTVAGGRSKLMHRFVERYLRDREAHVRVWEKTAVQHRAALKTLYGRWHVKPFPYAKAVLFERQYAPGSVFEAIETLKTLTPEGAARAITKFQIPFLVAQSILGPTMKSDALILALLDVMSPAELVNNVKRFEQWGVKTNPALRSAFETAMQRATTSKRASSTLKATKAAEVLEDAGDEVLAAKLKALQERQIETRGGVEGNWLVLADASPSMSIAIEIAKDVAAVLTRMVKGQVHLVFFDSTPRHKDVTGKTLDEIKALTKHEKVQGNGTSIGCGLALAMEKKLAIDGICIISDAKENTVPFFVERYQAYVKRFDAEPSVYLYRLTPSSSGYGDKDLATTMAANGLELVEFDLRDQTVDYYSLPNVVQTMRIGKYTLLDEIAATPLLTLDDVLKRTKGQPVLRRALVTA